MKIRMDRKMYAEAQRMADTEDIPFTTFVGRAVTFYHRSDMSPNEKLNPLTRENSVSVCIPLLITTPKRIRQCISIAIEKRRAVESDWPWRYDRSSLDAVVQLETFLGRSCNYHDAEAYIDRRIAERKAEIAAEEGKQKTKKGRK
jgi:hypothetical protein